MNVKAEMMSGAFAWRRIHSIAGLWLVVYLMVHLTINSQAALWLGDEGWTFVKLVNILESLPFLRAVELLFIGFPLLLHGYWGIRRLIQAKSNAFKSDGTEPSLPYARNRAFTWQRLTSWILLIGVVSHVVQMRFVQMPSEVFDQTKQEFSVKVSYDPYLETLAKRFDLDLKEIDQAQVKVTARTPGKAMLIMVRDTFKSVWMCILYTIFVLAASFHAFNGFWTALITWGVALSYRSQRAMVPICWLGVTFLAFLGLASIWGSYWLS